MQRYAISRNSRRLFAIKITKTFEPEHTKGQPPRVLYSYDQ